MREVVRGTSVMRRWTILCLEYLEAPIQASVIYAWCKTLRKQQNNWTHCMTIRWQRKNIQSSLILLNQFTRIFQTWNACLPWSQDVCIAFAIKYFDALSSKAQLCTSHLKGLRKQVRCTFCTKAAVEALSRNAEGYPDAFIWSFSQVVKSPMEVSLLMGTTSSITIEHRAYVILISVKYQCRGRHSVPRFFVNEVADIFLHSPCDGMC